MFDGRWVLILCSLQASRKRSRSARGRGAAGDDNDAPLKIIRDMDDAAAVDALEHDAAEGDAKPSRHEASTVVYLGHLPHGFYEKQLSGFLSQFGEIKRLRVARNVKTGKSQHHAFVEFVFPEVAAIVAQTMNKYFMFDKYLSAHVMAPEKVHDGLFSGDGRKFQVVPWRLIASKQHNSTKTPEKLARAFQNALRKDRLRQAALKRAGIDYEYVPLGMTARSKDGDDDAEYVATGSFASVPLALSCVEAPCLPRPLQWDGSYQAVLCSCYHMPCPSKSCCRS